jgi:hypothetical protein
VRMSEQTDKFVEALAKAQGELVNPNKGLTADIKSDKGRFQYRYADLAAVLNAVRPALSKNGIAIIQAPVIVQRSILLTTRLACGDQWIETDYPVASVENNHQQIGSALTYARRYSLLCMTGLMGENEDDDAAIAPPASESPRDDIPPPRRDPPAKAAGETTARKTNLQAKAEGDWEYLKGSLDLQRTLEELRAWATLHTDQINALPEGWVREINGLYRAKKDDLKNAEKLALEARRLDQAKVDQPYVDDSVVYDEETGEILTPEEVEQLEREAIEDRAKVNKLIDDDDLPAGLKGGSNAYAAAKGR